MKTWNGQIDAISSKDWNNILLWSFRIEGEDRWFRTQKKRLPAEVGDHVTFDERNNQVILESVVVDQTSAPSAPTTPEGVAAPVSPSVESTKSPATIDVGARIQWQAARRDACNVIVAALHTDSLPWNANLAKGKRLDMLRSYITTLTNQFLEEENG